MAPGTKIFVGRLPASCRREELHDLFAKYGTVKECDILTNYGFVHMSTPEEAAAAISGLHNYELDGTKITVEESTSRPRSKLPRSRGGGRGQPMYRRPQYRESYASQVGYQSQPWDRYGGRMRPYPDPYDDRSRYAQSNMNYSQPSGYSDYYYDQRQPTPPPAQPPPATDGYGASRDSYNRYSYDTSGYGQYADPYTGASTWSNF